METTTWNAGDFLDSPEAMAAYLNAAMEDGDPSLINAALGDVARVRGMTQMARDTGLAREALYRALRPEGRPEFTTVMKVIKALGLSLSTHVPARKSAIGKGRGISEARGAARPGPASRRPRDKASVKRS